MLGHDSLLELVLLEALGHVLFELVERHAKVAAQDALEGTLVAAAVVGLVDGGLGVDGRVDLVVGDGDVALLDLVVDDLLADCLIDQVLAVLLNRAVVCAIGGVIGAGVVAAVRAVAFGALLAALLGALLGAGVVARRVIRRVVGIRAVGIAGGAGVVLAVGDVVAPRVCIGRAVRRDMVAQLLGGGIGYLAFEHLAVIPCSRNLLAATGKRHSGKRRQSCRHGNNGNLLDDGHEASLKVLVQKIIWSIVYPFIVCKG